MTKIKFDSPMFYAGFPVFIALTKLSKTGEILATTYSSSYMLNDRLVMGIGADGQTASELTEGTKLSINYLSENDGLLSDIAGLVSRRTKLSNLTEQGAILTEIDDVPILENGLLSIIGKIDKILEIDGVKHLFVKITERYISDSLVKNDNIDWGNFDSLEYFGAGKERIYKSVKSDITAKGGFLKASRKRK
ncbi:hypothetical protein ACFO26_05180 [Lactococcus nasutitermitis]|uniref:Flavin reductase like domain-containing protein n=1 Tax=Lactococcus nasutitermitis TaxID=1652957 RepID=A0ABV9JCZ4_9LACT|nr:hypothetical protein [Lactococcus nasutitermitis]